MSSRKPVHSLEIEELARNLQIKVFRDVWKGKPPANLVDAFEPGIALDYLGFRTNSVPRIGQQRIGGVLHEVAGIIDPVDKTVIISEAFPPTSKRYTTAHELAHGCLHPNCPPMHRDFPLERNGVIRDQRETEANRFASAYLLPQKLVREQFESRFDCVHFQLTDATAFALCGANAQVVSKVWRDARTLSLNLACATHFNGKHFRSLAEHFKVAPLAMAIRLEELSLTRSK